MTEKITFTITDKGMTIDSEGFKGLTCLTELEKLQKFLESEGGIKLNIVDQTKKKAIYINTSSEVKGQEVRR
jgi:hypothetical protein